VAGGELLTTTVETSGARWVPRAELASLDLSTDRVTLAQLRALLRFAADPTLPVLCD
jgi:hypothetical protein